MAYEEIPKENWYSILNAEPSDSLAELKRKYQKLVLLYHPDKQSADVPAGEVEARMQRFIEIDRAWKILGNEETKKEYDLQRREHELTEVLPVDAQVSFQDMAWNCSKKICGIAVYSEVYFKNKSRGLLDHTKDNQCYSLICRCGGNYTISKNETEDVSLVCCDTCSLVIEILR